MSDLTLFSLRDGVATEIAGEAGGLEKSLQTLMESNLETLLGVKFIKSEHVTGKLHGGRIDTLGLDENNSPVIVEYKRAVSENVINQGLFYLDWLMDHKADFKLLVLARLGATVAEAIDWSSPRLICVAANFTKYDEHSVRQIDRNIDLVRYRKFGKDLVALELLTSTTASALPVEDDEPTKPDEPKGGKSIAESIASLDPILKDLWEEARAYIIGLGSDVSEKELKLYYAYRRIKNFASLCAGKKGLTLYLKVDPATVTMEPGFTRDVRSIGHWGTGDLEVWVPDKASLTKALTLIDRAYSGI